MNTQIDQEKSVKTKNNLEQRMALVRWFLLGAMVVASAAGWWIFVRGANSTEQQVAKYHCPMHPQITSDKPGDCPICGMRLEPMSEHHDSPPANQAAISTSAVSERELNRELSLPALIEPAEGAIAEVRVR